jgi:hypothetical protein
MPETSYWLDLCTVETWEKFRQAGGEQGGFRDDRWETAQRINRGDYLLSYLIGVSRWVGLLEVTGEASRDQPPRWEDDAFPVRVPVKVRIALTRQTGIPIKDMKDRLSIFQGLANPHAWTGKLRRPLTKWTESDGRAIVAALEQARADSV